MDLPPPRVEVIIVQEAQAPMRIPQVDLAVEVVGKFPLQTKLQDVSRLLGLRLQQSAGSFNRRYPSAILELITLVERNPAGTSRNWDAVHALTVRYHTEPRHVVVGTASTIAISIHGPAPSIHDARWCRTRY